MLVDYGDIKHNICMVFYFFAHKVLALHDS